ncbi:PilN domain-containing protein [Marinobacter sediminum]|uniref:PilN domain-containing protein n=1 Tax=Marinobacter sediminum TaxID=256323 RepID=UPI00202F2003|nr:PilN domain-containing protein [Marinobacter sediminum]MCM0610886.1 PilN domain-containing protein [Marinobacter sediminum]
MIQQVNLFTKELRPRKERLQAGAALGLVVLAFLVLVAAFAIVRYQNNHLEDRVALLEQQNRGLEQVVTQLSEAVRVREPEPDVQDALERITDTLARRQRLLERVESLVLDGGASFSPRMAALARQIPEDVWLTGIRLDAQRDRVTIEGRARSGALVPAYLENLGNEPVFTGKTFGAFRLSRPEEGAWIEFHVATERSGEGG